MIWHGMFCANSGRRLQISSSSLSGHMKSTPGASRQREEWMGCQAFYPARKSLTTPTLVRELLNSRESRGNAFGVVNGESKDEDAIAHSNSTGLIAACSGHP